MNVIKVKFIRDGEPKGQAYTYYSDIDVAVGELIEISEGKKGCVVEINVPPAEIEKFGDKAKTIKGVWVEPEPVVELENELVIEEPKAFDNLIVVKQLPIIEEHLKALSEEVEQKTQTAISLVCTEATVKEIKKVRSELNTQFISLEEQRKTVKKAITKPYNDFQSVYDTFIGNKFKAADVALKTKINEVENELKNTKADAVCEFYYEYAQARGIEIPFERAAINVTLSVTEKKLKEQCAEFIDRIVSDYALIDTQENKEEILAEYQSTLNVSQAITTVKNRHAEIERQLKLAEERTKQKEIKKEVVKKVEAVAPAKIIKPEPTYKVVFSVTGTKANIKMLVDFMRANNIEFKQEA